jgi:hypothetical protein
LDHWLNKVDGNMDFGILAASCACAVSLVGLFIELYKAAEDRPPPFPGRRVRLVAPTKTRALLVEFSDGKAATLPLLDDAGVQTRFGALLRVDMDCSLRRMELDRAALR